MSSALLLTLALQATPHAELHPADAEWFVESPDLPALFAAYPEAPMARLFADERALGALRRLLGAEDLTGTALVDRGLATLGLGGTTLDGLRRLEAASLSLRGARDGRAAGGLALVAAADADAAASFADDVPRGDPIAFVRRDGALVAIGLRGLSEAEWDALRSGAAPTLAPFAAAGLDPVEGPVVLRGFQRENPVGLLAELLETDLDPLPQAWRFLFGDGATRFRMALEHGRFVTTSHTSAAAHPIAGAPWVAPAPLDASLLSEVHPGSLFVAATSFDRDGLRAAIAAATGVDLADAAFFDKLGANAVLFAQPVRGPTLPRGFLVVELADPEGVLDALVALAERPELEGKVRVRSRPYREVRYVLLTLPPEWSSVADLGTVRPSFAVLDGKLFVSDGSLALKEEIRRRLGDEDEQFGPYAYPWSDAPADFVGADARALGYVDWAAQVEGLFSLARAFGGFLADDLPYDLTDLPPSTVFTLHMAPTTHVVAARDGGMHHRHVASFGFETWIGLAGLARTVAAGLEPEQPAEPPSAAEAPAPAPSQATAARLRDLRAALTVYRIDRGAYPDALERLVEPAPDYPRGYLDGRTELVPDGWGHPFRYERTADGAGYRVWSTGPDGVDQDGAGDDVLPL